MVKSDMIQLRYFARLRELLGISEEQLELPENIRTVGELRSRLMARGIPWQQALSDARLTTAVNHEIVKADKLINNGDEIAWFPPVTGG